jgi:glycerol-3-phosphate dehydrogenase
LLLTKGVHLVLPYEKLPLSQAVYFDVADGRMIFAIPRDSKTYIGTTDTLYNQDVDYPSVNISDVSYLLDAANAMFPNAHLKTEDVESSWAGLRPLIFEEGKGPSELSRKDEIIVSDSGLLSIAGGKLTGYRLMAEKIVDMAQAKLEKPSSKRNKTINYKLSGCSFSSEKEVETFIKDISEQYKISSATIKSWTYKYGDNTKIIAQNYLKQQSVVNDEELAALISELDYTIEYEMVLTAEDFIIRRSALLYFNLPLVKKYLNKILDYMEKRLNWSEEKKGKQRSKIELRIKEATTFL